MKQQTFFSDPAIDKMMSAFLALAAELHIAKAQQRAMASLLIKRGVLTAEELDTWQPSATEADAVNQDTARYVQAIFAPLRAESK